MQTFPGRWCLTVLVLVAIGVFSSTPVTARSEALGAESKSPSGPSFTLHALGKQDGGHFYIELEPGLSQTLTVVFGNRGDEPLLLRTYAADAVTLTNGGFGLKSEEAPISDPTSWLDYPSETHELEPMETIERTFSVTVPDGTPPGEHVTGIALQTAEPMAIEGTTVVDQVIRKIIGVRITVPGPATPAAALGEPIIEGDTSLGRLVVPFVNSGNVRLRPVGVLTLSDASGAPLVTAPIEMRSIYAGHATTLEVSIPPQLPVGVYTLDLQLQDSDTGWNVALANETVTLAAPEVEIAPAPVEITGVTMTPMPGNDSGEPPLYVDVAIEITNRSEPVASSRLVMVVERDGGVVEEVVLSHSLALLEPTTIVERPYIPADGWLKGAYTFSLVLESVDPNSGVEAMLATLQMPDRIVVP